MNSVYEPGSRIMSKNRLRNSTESNRVENRPSAPSAQPIASPRAQAARLASLAPRAPRAPATAAARAPACHACAPAPRARACVPRARAACCRTPVPLAAARPCHLLSRAPAPRAPQRRAPAPVPTSACRLLAHARQCAQPAPHAPAPHAPAPAPQRLPARPAPCPAQPYAQWAVALFRFCILFFFSFFFFISFSHWKTPKNIFIYFLSYSSTPINLLKFISSILLLFSFPNKPNKLLKFILFIFLFQFTHCKLQGLFSNMPMCYLPKHINIHITHTTCHTHQTYTYNHSSIHMITHKTHMSCPSFVPCLS